MFSVAKDWNPQQMRLSGLLSDESTFDEAVVLCKRMHFQLHGFGPAQGDKTIYQELLADLPREVIVFRPKNGFASIAWNVWHITRIEDAISTIIIGDENQVFSDSWMSRMNVDFTDTGNAFSKRDVDAMASSIDTAQLFEYRKAVGINTQRILSNLKPDDRKRKPTEKQLRAIIREKVVTKSDDSWWLLDFWSKKTVSGLLMMPITRHQIVHLNACLKLKKTVRYSG